jgi:hypothetical protein
LGLLLEKLEDFQLQRDDGSGGFLASLDARLMIGVDVDQGGIESDRPFEESDENTKRKWGNVTLSLK